MWCTHMLLNLSIVFHTRGVVCTREVGRFENCATNFSAIKELMAWRANVLMSIPYTHTKKKKCTYLLPVLNCFFWYFYCNKNECFQKVSSKTHCHCHVDINILPTLYIIHIQGMRAHVLFYVWWQPTEYYLIWIITFYSCNVPEC
jgi:hypothetical protein